MVGFLVQRPTFATLAMFPVLVAVYRGLAIREEREVAAELGPTWDEYAAVTPRFIPRGRSRVAPTLRSGAAKPGPAPLWPR